MLPSQPRPKAVGKVIDLTTESTTKKDDKAVKTILTNPYQRSAQGSSVHPRWVPGLTARHFTTASQQRCAATPTLVSSYQKLDTGAFIFVWNAPASRRGHNSNNSSTPNYALSIQGTANNVPTWKVHCSCPAFAKRGDDHTASSVEGITPQLRVCKHLHAALLTVLDPHADTFPPARTTSQRNDTTPPAGTATHRPPPHTDPADVRHLKKRKRLLSSHVKAATIKAGTESAPIHLLHTRPRTTAAGGAESPCLTLSELILGRQTTATIPAWIVVANFMVDVTYLVQEVPELRQIPRVVLFHGGHHRLTWPTTYSSQHNNHQWVDVQRLDPNADPQTSTNPCRYRFPFGSHHTKLFLVGYTDKIRVVVSTGNLQPVDAHKANAAYVEEFPRKNVSELHITTSDFEETLVHYIESYGYQTKVSWMGSGGSGGSDTTSAEAPAETLAQVLRRYDYSQARGILIPSIPGYHNITPSSSTPESTQSPPPQWMGQLKLRYAIRQHTTAASHPRPVVCQFTSIGTTSVAYLQTLQSSMDTCLARATTATAGSHPNHSRKDCTNNPQKSPALQLQLVYPTSAEIRQSMEGYSGGGTVPGSKKNVSKPHLQNLWYKYTSSSGSTSNNPLAQPHIVPHIKSYYQVSEATSYKDNELSPSCAFDWLCLTSHNISQPAWGVIRNNKKYPGQHLYIASWELGVFLSPQTLGVDHLVLYGTDAVHTTRGRVATVPMPYHTHGLEKYSATDTPWAWDEVYTIPDAYGLYSLQG